MVDSAAAAPRPAEIEAGRRLFAQDCVFVVGAASIAGVPAPDLPEVAFAGRSNVGKSSLINALTGRRTLARTSRTPGRTRQLNFFRLGSRLMLADLPGIGYARASKTESAAWTGLLKDYLRGRPDLRRCCLLIDARHGLKPGDADMMELLDRAGIAYRIVLTKADKAAEAELVRRVAAIAQTLARHAAALPDIAVTSARVGTGLAALRAELAALARP